MAKLEACKCKSTLVVFLLGVLTGALLVGFVFLYGQSQAEDYQNSVLKTFTVSPVTTQLDTVRFTNPIGGDGRH